MKSWLPFEVLVGLRFLRDGRMQTFFITIGITIGVAVIVFMSAMLAGLQSNFIKRVLTSQPHIQLSAPDEVARPLRQKVIEAAIVQRPSQRLLSIDQWPKVRAEMMAIPEISAVSPTAAGSALAVRGDASRSISINGIEPEAYYRIVHLPEYIIAGTAMVGSEDIAIGKDLAHDLGVDLRDKINVQASGGASRVLTVVGIFDLGNKGTNLRSTFVALRTAQSLLNLVGGVTTIDLTVTDIYAAETIASLIRSSLPVQADSWIKTNAQFFTAVQAQIQTNLMIRIFVGLSVAFGIAAVLIVSVIQRSRDIGILRAMGTTRGQILRVFLLQGALLGALGSLFGSAFGAGALVLFHSLARQADGTELFPLVLDPQLFEIAMILATATGLVAAIAPAVRAAKLDPVVAIRA
jgi:lipoprotein-releasing system permease protein